jgi:hypothetical protein
MDSVLPIFFCLILPLLWTGLIFWLGRWSAGHTISIQRRSGEQLVQAGRSPYYENFEEV